jgi:DNA-binding NarL/FixJ family response regulator
VLLVDDHPVVRRGLGLMIDDEKDMQVCGEAESYEQALKAIQEIKPDVAVVDVSLSGRSGIDLIKELRTVAPTLPVLVLSMHDETLQAERALRAGAKGYIMKREAPANVIDAIRQVLRGGIFVSERMSARLLGSIADAPAGTRSPLERLSDRELEIFNLIGQGLSPRTIAEKFGLSVKTIEAHRENIKGKLGLSSSHELIRYAAQHWLDQQAPA